MTEVARRSLTSKRWFTSILWNLMYIFLVIYGATKGFPETIATTVWGFIQVSLTPATMVINTIFIGAETMYRIKNNKP